MAKKVLVTGATGFTGRNLCKKLVEVGHSVRGLVRNTSHRSELESLGVEIAFGDLTDANSLGAAVRGIDTVYHLAAVYRQEGVPTKYFYEVNVEGTRRLLEAAWQAGVQRFVHCSTVGVQGEIKNPPADETAPYNPGDVYQESKCEGEKAALKFFADSGLPGVVIRPVGIYGPGDTRFLKLFKFIYNGKFRMLGSGNVLYHLTYIDDLVKGVILCGEKPEAVGQIYTLGGNEYVTLNELVTLVAEALEVPVPSKHFPVWPVWFAGLLCEMACRPLRIEPPIYRRRVDFFIKDRAFDISKARRELGYEPEVDLRAGLKRTAEWYRAQGLLD